MDNITNLSKTSEDIASSLQVLSRILTKKDTTNKELATKLNSFNNNVANNTITILGDRMENSLKSLGEQFKHINYTPSTSTADIESTIRRKNLLTEKIVRSELLSEYYDFYIYPFYHVEDRQRRRFIEKRFIARFKPPLNLGGM